MSRRAPQRDSVMSYTGDRRMRLHRVLAHRRELKSFFDDYLSLREASRGIAFNELLAVTNVAAELSADAGDVMKFSAARHVGMQARRALRQRRVNVGDTGQFLIMHVDP